MPIGQKYANAIFLVIWHEKHDPFQDHCYGGCLRIQRTTYASRSEADAAAAKLEAEHPGTEFESLEVQAPGNGGLRMRDL